MTSPPSYRIFPISDSALTIDFGNIINTTINQHILSLFRLLSKEPLPGMIEATPAYSSCTVYYDLFQLRKLVPANKTVQEWMAEQLVQKLNVPLQETNLSAGLIKIPVCYEKEFAPDIKEVTKGKNISPDEVIQIHISRTYYVYMIGFLPGFTYMGEVDEKIETPRKLHPRQKVEAGSVGIAGKQTGIYPLSSPGGWQIIGRTPLKMFDATKKEPTLLKAGDTVQFYPISKNEFENF